MMRGWCSSVGLLAAFAIAAPAAAQDMPLIDGVGAWSHSQTMRHRTGENARNTGSVSSQASDTEGHRRLMALSPESRRSLIALKPELDRRTKANGAEAANRWFETKVAEAERREGIGR